MEQQIQIAYRDDVVVKNTMINGVRILSGENDFVWVKSMTAGDRLTGRKRLARRIFSRAGSSI